MGLQLIFVVETNKKNQSDWIYIKETINRFFNYDQAHVKLKPVYMNGKGNYRSKKKEIETLVSEYKSSSKDNISHVVMCLDCDDYDSNAEDKEFLDNAKKYCDERSWDLIWFYKDVEQVYWEKKVSDIDKKAEAAKYKAKKMIDKINRAKLESNTYKKNTSNILAVMRKYLEEKENETLC